MLKIVHNSKSVAGYTAGTLMPRERYSGSKTRGLGKVYRQFQSEFGWL